MKLLKRKVTNQPPPLGIRDFLEKRNRVLFMRQVGGLGDILMHRMMFEDFKRVMPDIEIHWAVPREYFEAACGHPFVDKILDSASVNPNDYVISYNTTTACGRYEARIAPMADKHRSDIWANHCGVLLTKHNMHITLEQDKLAAAKMKLQSLKSGPGPSVIFSPISSMPGKNLDRKQMQGTANRLKAKGYNVIGLHTTPIRELIEIKVPVIHNISITEWMHLIGAADYILSVDTGQFHMAGGVHKPLVGIFTYIDGQVYGKYYDFILVQKHRTNGDWDCGPCFNWGQCTKCVYGPRKPCVTEITVDMIVDACERMFSRWPIETTYA